MIFRDALNGIIEHTQINGYAQGQDAASWFFGSQLKCAAQFASYQEARDYARALGFTAPDTAGTPGYTSVSVFCHHPEAIALAKEEREVAAGKWRAAKKVYVRFGRLPPGGKSTNFRDGIKEAGVSVFRGEQLPNGEVRLLFSRPDEMGSYHLGLNKRKMRIVTGREIGIGSDGEPLLADARYAD
jgi:hypothetical protein